MSDARRIFMQVWSEYGMDDVDDYIAMVNAEFSTAVSAAFSGRTAPLRAFVSEHSSTRHKPTAFIEHSIGDEAREVGSRARRDPRGRDVSCEMWVGCRFAVRVVLLLKRLLSVGARC